MGDFLIPNVTLLGHFVPILENISVQMAHDFEEYRGASFKWFLVPFSRGPRSDI
jgi:hypothetical protein